VMAWGLSKLRMLMLMGPVKKGNHVGKWGITMENAKKFEISTSNESPLIIGVDGEAVITTPATMQYHDDQLTVRGATSIPNE